MGGGLAPGASPNPPNSPAHGIAHLPRDQWEPGTGRQEFLTGQLRFGAVPFDRSGSRLARSTRDEGLRLRHTSLTKITMRVANYPTSPPDVMPSSR
jgi:hypothetical protein